MMILLSQIQSSKDLKYPGIDNTLKIVDIKNTQKVNAFVEAVFQLEENADGLTVILEYPHDQKDFSYPWAYL